MTSRIFKSIFLTSTIAAVVACVFVAITLYNTYDAGMMDELITETGHIRHALSREQSDIEYFEDFSSRNRITLIAPDGSVLYDNKADASLMENHADRPEVIEAYAEGAGQSRRFSATLSEQIIYYAVKTDQGNILRVSNTQRSVLGMLWGMLTAFILIIIVVAIISFIVARSISRRIVAPINTLNLDAPLENDTYDELSPLLLRMAHQNQSLHEKMKALEQKQHELSEITTNMREGLVLINQNDNIISINQSAARVFNTDVKSCIGEHVLFLNRSESLQNVVREAQTGSNAEALLKINSRHYRLIASPFLGDRGAKGIVLLILDITDKHVAERSRREFTANVTHELKTPLTSIIGYAEIMRDGVAKQQDMQGFAGRIYDEASRLIALVDDILRLSQLDEKIKLPQKQNVDLLVLAQDVRDRLQPLAAKREVEMTVRGDHVLVLGVRKLLDEMLFNLCDNAIKYNVPDGTVAVEVAVVNGKPVVSVKDTGIGIPKEHQTHVFERFYRVDKSHSKETGGTGLGLSIVKHVAKIHRAQIELESEHGKGTSIRLIFNTQ